jgi:hypothetical protein
MHLLLAIAAVALLYWIVSQRGRRAPPVDGWTTSAADAGTEAASTRRLAYIAHGKMFCAEPGQAPREIHSAHVQAAMDRLERTRERNAWKEGTTFSVRAGGEWRGGPGRELPLYACSVRFAPGGRLVYFLRDKSMGGLFEQDLASGQERRLIHRQNFLLDDLQLSADGLQLLCSQQSGNGTANIVGMNMEGGEYRELTGGDTIDSAPCWVPGKPGQLVFQSSGLARGPEGHVVAIGPASIQLLDTQTGALHPVFEDARFDYLQPRVTGDGDLLFIRRPYEGQRHRGGDLLLDTLLFPFRLLRTLFHFLNFQSLVYSRKPLTSASGPQQDADLKGLLLKGRYIDAEAAMRSGKRVDGAPVLVPASWELVLRTERGEERVLARHVASFDLTPDGGVVYSNGFAVYALHPGGQPSLVLRGKLMTDITAG